MTRWASAFSGMFSIQVTLILVAELLFDELAGDVMLGGPAFLVGRADVDEGDLQRLVLGEDGDRGGVERDGRWRRRGRA